MLFDSGTTYTYFSYQLMHQWRKIFDQFCKKEKRNCGGYDHYSKCYKVDNRIFPDYDQFIGTFPEAQFYFDGQKYT